MPSDLGMETRTTSTDACIDETVALALLEGRAGTDAARRHVARCDECRGFLAGLAKVMLPASAPSWGGWNSADELLPPGSVLGEYRVESVLGRGGMGVVYEAHDLRLERRVAIKVLRDDLGARRVAWLRREAAAMAKLSHPHVAQVFDFGVSEQRPFVVMERIDGVTLGEWAAQGRTPAEICQAYVQAGRGLAAAHAAGLVHRDFKPSNAMVVAEGDVGRVKVLDFGLSGGVVEPDVTADAHGPNTLRGGGGTPRYASPEQLRGGVVGPASDQFSFCVAMFEALSGVLPYAGESPGARTTAMLSGAARSVPAGVPTSVGAALTRGLSLDPRARFASMDALLDALVRPGSGRRWAAVLSVGALVALGALVWPSPPVPCDDGTARMQRVWPRPREAGWSGRPEVRRRGEELDRYVDAWLQTRREACEVRPSDPARFERVAACLERESVQIERAGRRLQLLASTQTPLPSNLFGDLHAPGQCLTEDDARPMDELLRDEFDALNAFAAEAQDDEGLDAEELAYVADAAAQLQRRADDLGDTRVQASLHTLRGKVALKQGDYASTERHLEAAFFAAELARDAQTQFDACDALVVLLAQHLVEPQRAGYWADQAERVAECLDDDEKRGAAAFLRGTVHNAAGRPQQALESLNQAASWVNPESLVAGDVVRVRGEVHMALGQSEAARRDLVEAVRLAEINFGADHPDVAAPVNALATVELFEGNLKEGGALLERALGLLDPRQKVHRAYLRCNLAQLYRNQGRHQEALDAFEDAQVVLEARLGLLHPAVTQAKVESAEILAELDRDAEALARIEDVLEDEVTGDMRVQALLLHSELVDDPRPDLEAAANVADASERWKIYAREALAEFDSVR